MWADADLSKDVISGHGMSNVNLVQAGSENLG
jgi:hypothetical protein